MEGLCRPTGVGWGAFALSLSHSVHRAGSPPRRAGNFLLLRQKKVTKEEALNRKSPRACDGQHAKTDTQRLSRSDPLRSRCCPCHRPNSPTVRAPNVGCTPNSRGETQAPPERRVVECGAFTGEPGVQPALTGRAARWMALVTGAAARAQRVASAYQQRASFRARAFAPARWCAVSASLLVTFLWQDREKLPARRGGLPARCTELKGSSQKPPATNSTPRKAFRKRHPEARRTQRPTLTSA